MAGTELLGRAVRASEVRRTPRAPDPPARSFRLSDGRLLSFLERGDPAGVPIVYFHGALGSRCEWPIRESSLAGVRLLTPERPGFGHSSPARRRTVLEWAGDVRRWLDALGVGRFAAVAWSSGCSYALACASTMPDRVAGLDLAGAVPPLGRGGHGLMALGPIAVARYTPGLATCLLRSARLPSRILPAVFRAMVRVGIASQSLKLSRDPDAVRALESNHAEALRQGGHGVLQDLAVTTRDWGFPLENLQLPVTLWNSTSDTFVRPAAPRWLEAALPHAAAVWVDGGHAMLFVREREILQSAAEKLLNCSRPAQPAEAAD